MPFAGVDVAVGAIVLAEALLSAVDPFAFVNIPKRRHHYTVAVKFAVDRRSLVHRVIPKLNRARVIFSHFVAHIQREGRDDIIQPISRDGRFI